MKSLMLLSLVVTRECGDIVGASTVRDCKTIADRFEHEGMSFLTITLPQFAKDFERSLAREEVRHDLFHAFAWQGGLPRFLGGFLDKVFDRGTGRLLDMVDPEAVRAVRQICLLHGKILINCTPERERKAIEGYIETENHVRLHEGLLSESDVDDFVYYSNLLWRDVFLGMEKSIYQGRLIPKHGPGKTADRIQGNLKFASRSWTERLEKHFPARDYLLPNQHHLIGNDAITWSKPGTEIPARVTLVPKTLKAPRIIAIEPTCMQYMQQALLREFLVYHGEDSFLRDIVGFRHQPPNQELARKGSIDGSLATLDLSEASDRVSNRHVGLLFRRHSLLAEAVESTRSLTADVPGHGVIPLTKFASMGSALTFAMEAVVFSTIIFMAIGKKQSRRLTRRDVKSFRASVRVFGDDLIVPNEYAPDVIACLESFGYKVNASKSFWSGSFRESCGKEYFNGYDVSIVKTRRVLPASRTDARELKSTVAFRNLMYNQGMWATARWLDKRIRELIPFPIVESTCAGLGRHSFLGWKAERGEAGKSLQRPLVKAAFLHSKAPKSDISDDGVSSLLKWFLKQGVEPFELGSYERQGRPDTVSIKVRWTPPF